MPPIVTPIATPEHSTTSSSTEGGDQNRIDGYYTEPVKLNDVSKTKAHDAALVNSESAPPKYKIPRNAPVVHYQKLCDKCDWKSHLSYDPAALVGLVAELDFHTKDKHSNDQGVGVAEQDNFALATKPVLFSEGMDDNNNLFHEARHRSGPMNWKGPYKTMPLSHKVVVAHRDLTHLGVPTRDSK